MDVIIIALVPGFAVAVAVAVAHRYTASTRAHHGTLKRVRVTRRALCGPRFLSSLTNAWIGCGFAARFDKRHFNAFVEVSRFTSLFASRREK